jgi:hypothetical protein
MFSSGTTLQAGSACSKICPISSLRPKWMVYNVIPDPQMDGTVVPPGGTRSERGRNHTGRKPLGTELGHYLVPLCQGTRLANTIGITLNRNHPESWFRPGQRPSSFLLLTKMHCVDCCSSSERRRFWRKKTEPRFRWTELARNQIGITSEHHYRSVLSCLNLVPLFGTTSEPVRNHLGTS